MPQSKKRKGHKKRVEARNERIKKEWKTASELAWKKFEQFKNEDTNNKNI